MLVGSGPERTFDSEIPANDDGWEKKEGGIMGAVCVLPLCLGKGYLLLRTSRDGLWIS